MPLRELFHPSVHKCPSVNSPLRELFMPPRALVNFQIIYAPPVNYLWGLPELFKLFDASLNYLCPYVNYLMPLRELFMPLREFFGPSRELFDASVHNAPP